MASKSEKPSSGKRGRGAASSEDAAAPEGLAEPGRVLVTGISGNLGRLLARNLHRVAKVIGVDRRPFPNKPKDVEMVMVDLRRRATEQIFRDHRIDAVVHLNILHDPRKTAYEHHTYNVVGTKKLIGYCEKYGVRKFLVLSTANVYGPRPENTQFLTEDSPLLGDQDFHEIRDLITVDHLCQSFFWKVPEVETVILRPVHIVGAVRNAPSNYLRLRKPMKLMGFDPMVQTIHEEDAVRAIEHAIRPGVQGVFNVSGCEPATLSKLQRMAEAKPRHCPHFVAEGLINTMWRWRLVSFPAPEVDHLRYVCMVDGSQAQEAMGFVPKFDLEETMAHLRHTRMVYEAG
jgi:UDP-glucose 4-epimerase